MCTFQVNTLLCKSASRHLAYNCVLNHYWELSSEVFYQILSQGISELQEVRDEIYKNAYVFYWSNFESQKVVLILLEIKLYAIPHLKALTSDWHIYGRLGCCCTQPYYLPKRSTQTKFGPIWYINKEYPQFIPIWSPGDQFGDEFGV